MPLALLAGCFGDGDGPERIPGMEQPVQTGVFVDSEVSGVSWQTGSGQGGLTDDAGEFSFLPFETVTFSIGTITLGSSQGQPFVSPVELTGSGNPTEQAALNQLVFLQSIDADGDPTNGIQVTDQMRSRAEGLTLDFRAGDFQAQVAAVVEAISPGNAVVSELDALDHFYETYTNLGGTDAFAFSFPGFPPTGGGVTYELVFADEFNEGTAPDPEKWNFETGYGVDDSGWGNNEWQLYTDSPENVRVEDGNLVIQARCPTAPDCGVRDDTITSARITTQDKFEFRYGTVIARIKPPVGPGAWPAFWSLGANFPEIGWPRSGEIDFMEMHNAFSNEFTTHFTMHWCDETVNPALGPTETCFPAENGWVFETQNRSFPESLGDDFHLFEADWTEERIIARLDGVPVDTSGIDIEPATMEEFLREFFMILNVAMGGTLGSNNQPPSGDEVWPQTMLVDYVRVFQRTDEPSVEFFVDFEGSPDQYVFSDFQGGRGDVVANPVAGGINTSAQVARVRKFAGEPFAGTTLATALEVPSGSAFEVKVYSARPVDVLFKLEGSPASELELRHGGSGWELMTFSFPSVSGSFTGITFIFDNGTVGDAENAPADWTFYVDDITRVASLAQISLPITFDDPGVDYTLTDFGQPVAVATTLVADPENPGNTVASTTRPDGASPEAGTTMSTSAGFAAAIPFTSTRTTVGVRVYSPQAGVPVRLRARNGVGGPISVEAEVSTTVANQWETLVFDFAEPVDGTPRLDLATSYTALSIFFDFGAAGDGRTYLWDDVVFGLEAPDLTPPSLTGVSISSSNADATLATTGDVVSITLTADEPIERPTVTIAGVPADSVAGVGASWVASRTLTGDDPDGVVAFSIAYADLAGNEGMPVSTTTDNSSVTLDATPPALAITGAPASFTNLDPIALTFEFSEPVTGFEAGDIDVLNGRARDFAAVDEESYEALVTPNGTGDLSVAVAAGAVTDAAGNLLAGAVGATIGNALDPDAPLLTAVTISSSNTNPGFANDGDVVTIDMTANEAILEPTVMIAGAPADAVSGAGTSWQASRTMLQTDAEGEIGFSIDFEDLDNTAGPRTTIPTDDSKVVFDVTEPTLSITGLPPVVQTTEPVTVTFEFDEAVSGFANDDIDVINGVADAFVGVDDRTYTADVTPDGPGDLTVSVAAGVATDLAGNGSRPASLTVTVDLQVFWQPVWSDEFDGVALDPANWTIRTDADCPAPCRGIQSYRSERVGVVAGSLSIDARDDVARGGTQISSGLIDTRGNRELRYGRVEVDMKLPAGTAGVTPSVLLLPAGGEYGTFPLSGSIDVTNALDGGLTALEHSLRYGVLEPEDTTATAQSDAPIMASSQFLTYAVEWEAGEIRWFVDGVHVATQIEDNWYTYAEDSDGVYAVGEGAAPFDQDFYLAIGLPVDAPGGTYPQILQVDAVRVFRCANTNPDTGEGCAGLSDDVDPGIVPVVATSPPYNGAPFTEALEVYTDAPATLDFVDDDGMATAGMLVPETFADPGVTVASTIDAPGEGGNVVWNVNIDAAAGSGGVIMGPADLGAANGVFDLTGGGTAGEVLFRMRVNSAGDPAPQLAVGLDGDGGAGAAPLTFEADGTFRQYSVKVEDIVNDSVVQMTDLDLSRLSSLFRLTATGGAVDLDLDDVQVKVACRDVGRCEATARRDAPPVETIYSEDFENFTIDDINALGNAGWLVFGEVFTGDTFQFGYGAFPAPNGPSGSAFFSALVAGQGGNDQGSQQLSIFNDYNCCINGNRGHFDMTLPFDTVTASVFQERTITADDVGSTWTFSWDAKADTGPDGLGGLSTALASIKTLDPNDNFGQTNFITADMTSIPDTWQRYEISLPIDAGLVGQILQFGFASTARQFEPSNVFYDNLLVTKTGQ